MLADALKDIDQIGVRVHALQRAGREQALDHPDALGAEFRPGEQPAPPSHGDRSEAALKNDYADIGIMNRFLSVVRSMIDKVIELSRAMATQQRYEEK